METLLRLFTTFILVATTTSISATTFYVDFEGGDDANSGLGPSTAWKRAPGDPNATGKPSSTLLGPGDTVLFKGGVTYKGRLDLSRSGSDTVPLTYKGDGWGAGKAVLEGADDYKVGWTACPTAVACGDNPNFANVYFAAAPSGYKSFLTALYENGEFLWYSQSPNPTDPFYHDEIADFYRVPFPNTTVIQNQGSITDPRVLTHGSGTFWNGASIAGWITGNLVEIRPITSYDPATSTLYHQPFTAAPYKDREGRYALMNHVSLIDRPGEYAFDQNLGRIYLWPRNGKTPSSNSYTIYARDAAFNASAAISNVIIEGFTIKRFTYGFLIGNSAARSIILRGNDIGTLRSHDKYAIFLNARDSLVEDNRIIDANRSVGILSSAENIVIRRNHVERTSRQGIWLMGARNSQILDNTVVDIAGSHANGISIYSGAKNILVSGNRIIHVNSAISFEQSADITFANNIIAPSGQISDWYGMSGAVSFYNNTFPASGFYLASTPTYTFRNNILQRPPPKGTRSHNIYTTSQTSLQQGEAIEKDPNRLFLAPSIFDFRNKVGSIAIDTGTAVAVSTDIDGISRPQGLGWDIGAHEFKSGLNANLSSPTNLRFAQ